MKIQERYFFYSLLAVVSVFAVAIIWPFLTVIIVSASLATVLHPAYLWFKKKFRVGRQKERKLFILVKLGVLERLL